MNTGFASSGRKFDRNTESLMEIYNVPVVWHSGGIAGFNSIMMYLPSSKTKIVLLSNTENGIMPVWENLQKIIATFN